MSADITITGGGDTGVASAPMLEAHAALQALGDNLTELADALQPAVALANVAPDAASYANVAAHGIRDAAAQSRSLALALDDSAQRYGAAEQASQLAAVDASETGGWALGRLASILGLAGMTALPLLLPALLAVLAGIFGGASLAPGGSSVLVADVRKVLKGKAYLLRDPQVVALIRLAVSSTDDTMLSAVGAPLPLTRLLDDRRSGLFGLRGATAVTMGIGSLFGMFRETPVHVEQAASSKVAPPASFTDLASRVPASVAGGAQVRIERYDGAGGTPTYMVYVGGTVAVSPHAGSEPFDLTSDLAGIAGPDAASIRATQLAMQQAGIQPGDTVIPVGYSQGGIVATSIVASGVYNTPSIITFGSPTGGIDLPANVTDVAVEHSDDLVPALGGEPRGASDGGADRILVRRQTYDGAPPVGSSPIDAHVMSQYAITAGSMDASSDSRLAAALATLPKSGGGEEQLYRGIRGEAPAPTAVGGVPVAG